MYEKQRILFLSFFPCRKKEVESPLFISTTWKYFIIYTRCINHHHHPRKRRKSRTMAPFFPPVVLSPAKCFGTETQSQLGMRLSLKNKSCLEFWSKMCSISILIWVFLKYNISALCLGGTWFWRTCAMTRLKMRFMRQLRDRKSVV